MGVKIVLDIFSCLITYLVFLLACYCVPLQASKSSRKLFLGLPPRLIFRLLRHPPSTSPSLGVHAFLFGCLFPNVGVVACHRESVVFQILSTVLYLSWLPIEIYSPCSVVMVYIAGFNLYWSQFENCGILSV